MREIKFRAWHTLREEMFPVWGLDFDYIVGGKGNVRNMLSDPSREMEAERIFDEGGQESLIDLMQFTGFRDKNGKDIYEGDIVRVLPNNPNGYVAEVYWQEGGFETTSVDGNASTALHATIYEAVRQGKCEVIGNIYENPELLK